MKLIVFFLVLINLNIALAFEDCADIGEEPKNAPKLYEIINNDNGEPSLKPVADSSVIDSKQIFEAVNENFRFTTYRCWDENKNTTGFDPQLITEIVATSGEYNYIRFTTISWEQPEGAPISFFSHLDNAILNADNFNKNGNVEGGSVAQAGMSITEERLEWGAMVGPIYKAGKVLIGRIKNNKTSLNTKKRKALMLMPNLKNGRYEALRGLTLVSEGNGSIRGDYFLNMDKKYPGLIKFLKLSDPVKNEKGEETAQLIADKIENNKLNVILTSNNLINKLVEGKLANGKKIFNTGIDLTLIDTGSVVSLKAEQKIAKGVVEIVSRNLSLVDDELSYTFGQGDGIVVSKVNTEMINFVEKNLRVLVCNNRLEELIQKWFNDSNTADLSWANCEDQ